MTERADTIRQLRREGLTLRAICERLGVAKSAVNRALYERVREYEKVYSRERYYTRHCERCGKPSTFNPHGKKVKGQGRWCRECYAANRAEILATTEQAAK